MNFIVLLVSYFLQQKLKLSWSRAFDQLILALLRPKQFSLMVKSPVWSLLLVLFIVAAFCSITYLYYFSVADVFYGGLTLFSHVILLLLLIGRAGFKEDLNDYLSVWKQANFEAASLKQERLSSEGGGRFSNPVEMQNQVCTDLLYHNFNRFFVIIFWFMVLGPEAAVVTRVVDLMARHSSGQLKSSARIIKQVVEWLPVRLLAFSFALTGDFKGAIRYCVVYLIDFVTDSSTVLRETASGALDSYDLNHVVPIGLKQDDLIARGERGIGAIRDLMSRSMALWLGVFAVAAIIGW